MLDHADIVVINKFTRQGSEDAYREVGRQFRRSRALTDTALEDLPVFGTVAAQFNDGGVNSLYGYLIGILNERFQLGWQTGYPENGNRITDSHQYIIPHGRERYLSEIAEACRDHRGHAGEQADVAADTAALARAILLLGGSERTEPRSYSPEEMASAPALVRGLMETFNKRIEQLDPLSVKLLSEWDQWRNHYEADTFKYEVRGKAVTVDNYRTTLSELRVPKVALPKYRDWGDRLYWRLTENAPGEFPYTAGVFPYKRQQEDPTRMFAGEGPSERTNRRFHLLADGQPAKRLSTAFDSITLYGENPGRRPDIYGKIGESGVSVFTVEEAERLYAGFDLCDSTTSVSMTINGPAPTILAFFFATATRQECRKFLKAEGRLDVTDAQCLMPDVCRETTWEETRALLTHEEYLRMVHRAVSTVRGTVQADILKEDQGQNTCIFSTEFSLKVMGDVQEYFIGSDVRNFYSVSISGYHIAEAGANPIHQLAFTLANGFTYVEYYRSRGMPVDQFAPNLSFFFSNGMDTEYTVIGRVARRIWSVAMNRLYGGNERSQKLKYHIQTSGRSLHAIEIEFNDIRTTLQALLAIYDNAQSLHTNAYDEAITTPTEESVRRAMAIQLIINKEFGLLFCENSTQGSFIVEELTDLVEEAVLAEFDRLTRRGGVLGAMERQYQRGAIQDDSLKYEHLKHSGDLPLIGVNTFLPRTRAEASEAPTPPLTRATVEEKDMCIRRLEAFHEAHRVESALALQMLKDAALAGENVFTHLMDAVDSCSLGQITHALYEVGGEYRRNL
jgi:methylmalonyl-CoA mutase